MMRPIISLAERQKDRIFCRKVGLAVIAGLLLGMFATDITHYCRRTAYHIFRVGACFLLDHQTKKFAVCQSTHFVLKYTPQDRELAPAVLALAEDYLQEAEEILGTGLKGRKSLIPVVLYADEASLNKSLGWTGDRSTVGVYWAGAIRLVSPLGWQNSVTRNMEEALEMFAREGPLTHELTHLLVDEISGGNYPRWLTEGLAQYTEERVTGFTLGIPTPEESGKAFSFAEMERRFDDPQGQYLAYWQALQAVRQLIGDYGQERMRTLLITLGQGYHFRQAFAATYGVAFDDFAGGLLCET